MIAISRAATSGAALLLLACLPVAAQQGKPPPAVIAAHAERRAISDSIEALGTVQANESVRIAANTTEKIVELHFDDGQQVAAGDLLLLLNDAEEQAELKAAQAGRVERQNAYDRAAELATKNVGAKAARDDARAMLLKSDAEIEAIRVRIAEHRIRAPFAGIVGLRNLSVGALVSPGTVLLTLDDVAVVKVDFSVPASFLSALAPGLRLTADNSAWPQRHFEGMVKSVDTRVDPVTRTVLVRATLDNADRALLPGMLMKVHLQAGGREALLLPEGALVPQGGQQYVYVIDEKKENRVERRPVGTGARVDGQVEIVEGIAEGELVVTHGTINVRPGQAVRIRAIDDGSRSVAEMLLSAPAAAQ